MMKRYRAAIVGLTGIGAGMNPGGHRAAMPTSHAGAYAVQPEVDLVAVCDLHAKLIDEFRANWATRFPDAQGYTDYRRMLGECGIEVLSVVTSDHRHAEIVVDACRAGVRAIFCEKPIATSLEDADRMIAAAREAGVILAVNHTRRWYPLYHHVRERLRAGDIGRLTRVVGYMGGPRAMLFRNGSHLVDTVLMLVESRPEWVWAELDPGFEEYFAYQGDGGRDPGGDPGATAYLHFENGARAFLCASKDTPKGFALDLYGERGRIHVSDLDGAILTVEGRSQRLVEPQLRLTGTAAGIDELIRRLSGEVSELSCPPEQGRLVLQVLLAFLRSQELGHRPVSLAAIDN